MTNGGGMELVEPSYEANAPAATQGQERQLRHALIVVAERGGLLLMMGILFAFFALDSRTGTVFSSKANWDNILGSDAVTGLVALAMVVPMAAGYFDLSVASITGAANVACAAAIGTHHMSITAGIAIAIGIGAAIGVTNGFLVAKLGLNGFVVTLGMYTLLQGLIQLYTNGKEITDGIPASFGNWGSADWLGIPRPFVLLMIAATLTWYLIMHTPQGRYLEGIGTNEPAARLVGINVTRIVWGAFIVTGILAGAAGVLQTSYGGGADPTVSNGLLFPALAAVFLGATTIRPGRYNVWGAMLAVYFVAMSVSGFTLLGAQSWVQQAFDGGVLIFAIALSTFMARRRRA